MRFENTVIESFAYATPVEIISSAALEKKLSPIYERLRLPEGRLELQTGIQQRGIWPAGFLPSDIAVQAAQKCLQKSQIEKKKIGALIHASVCRDFLEPATASAVHSKLELPDHCHIFDLSNACLGFVNGMIMVSNMIMQGQIEAGLIVSGENSGPLLEETIRVLNHDESITRKSVKKYIANLTIGSAGVAMILTRENLCEEGPRLLGAELMSDTSALKLCQGDGNTDSLMMHTDSEALLHAGIKLGQRTWSRFFGENKVMHKVPDKIITHQVGTAHRKLMLESLNLPDDRDFISYDKWGNTGSAALPLTLCLAAENDFLQKGDQLALLGIGSGLNSIMMGVSW